jgi:hypothetical protein
MEAALYRHDWYKLLATDDWMTLQSFRIRHLRIGQKFQFSNHMVSSSGIWFPKAT